MIGYSFLYKEPLPDNFIMASFLDATGK